MTETAEIKALCVALIKQFDDLKRLVVGRRPPMSRKEFSRLTGYSYKQVCRLIADGEVAIIRNRILPLSLSPPLSPMLFRELFFLSLSLSSCRYQSIRWLCGWALLYSSQYKIPYISS